GWRARVSTPALISALPAKPTTSITATAPQCSWPSVMLATNVNVNQVPRPTPIRTTITFATRTFRNSGRPRRLWRRLESLLELDAECGDVSVTVLKSAEVYPGQIKVRGLSARRLNLLLKAKQNFMREGCLARCTPERGVQGLA